MPGCAGSNVACNAGRRAVTKTEASSAAVWRGLVVPGVLLLLWIGLSQSKLIDPRLLVPPSRVLAVPFTDPDGSTIWLSLLESLARMLTGFAIGAGFGAAFGFVMGVSRFGQRLLGLSFNALRQITLFAWIPLLTAWFGNGEGAKLVFIAMSAFFPMALNTLQGLREIPVAQLELAQALRLRPWTRFSRLLLPAALPAIALGIELALIGAWIGTVGAEYAMGFGRGIGIYLAEGREQFRMDIVIVGAIALALVGYAMNFAFHLALNRLVPWRRANS
jgi:sulfonate transport system permease protein